MYLCTVYLHTFIGCEINLSKQLVHLILISRQNKECISKSGLGALPGSSTCTAAFSPLLPKVTLEASVWTCLETGGRDKPHWAQMTQSLHLSACPVHLT